ncbi:hypothetical protein SALBM217S_10704 [Streptomyces griseoloalbus]
MSGPGAACRRVESSGREAMSRAGTPSGSSLGVGACTTGAVRGRAGPPSASTGTAQVTDQCGRSRSSTGRSASSSGVRSPCAVAVRQRVVPSRESVTTVSAPSVPRRTVRTSPSPISTTTSSRPGRASSRASSTAPSSRSARSAAAVSRSGRMTAVSYGSGAGHRAGRARGVDGGAVAVAGTVRHVSPAPGFCGDCGDPRHIRRGPSVTCSTGPVGRTTRNSGETPDSKSDICRTSPIDQLEMGGFAP